jgi:hypothetical protein
MTNGTDVELDGQGNGETSKIFAGQSSWRVVEKLPFKFLPGRNQSMPGKNNWEAGGVQHPGLDELEQAGFVLGASGLGNAEEASRPAGESGFQPRVGS